MKIAYFHLVLDACAACGEPLKDHESNNQPVWSDAHDDVVCWWCANHDEVPA